MVMSLGMLGRYSSTILFSKYLKNDPWWILEPAVLMWFNLSNRRTGRRACKRFSKITISETDNPNKACLLTILATPSGQWLLLVGPWVMSRRSQCPPWWPGWCSEAWPWPELTTWGCGDNPCYLVTLNDRQASVNPESPTVGAGVSGLLAGVMGARAAKSGKVLRL